MLWTVFKVLMVVLLLTMLLDFGVGALPIVLVVSLTALLLRLTIRRTSFRSGKPNDPKKAGKFKPTIVEQFGGPSTVNSRFRDRIARSKEQYL
jgi:hypothetical protein